MRIAILTDDYLPNSTLNHAKMLHHLGMELVNRGHEVIVITPSGHLNTPILDVDKLDEVCIWRFRSRPTHRVGHARRAMNETLLSFYALSALFRFKMDCKFDLTINYSPTIFFGPLVAWLKRKGAFVYLILRDFFPQWIIDEGIIRDRSLVARYFRYFEALNYRKSDVVAVQSFANVEAFFGISPYTHPKVEVLYNWSLQTKTKDTDFGVKFISKNGLQEKFIFFYGGNIGHAQDISNLLRLSKNMESLSKAHFLFVGQGDQYNLVESAVNKGDVTNVTITPSICQSDYLSLLTQVDVGLFSLSSKHQAHNFPGKVTGYFAAGLPVLGSVNDGNDLADIINGAEAGFVYTNGDDDELCAAATRLISDKVLRDQYSVNASALLKDKFNVSSTADQILKSFKSEVNCA